MAQDYEPYQQGEENSGLAWLQQPQDKFYSMQL